MVPTKPDAAIAQVVWRVTVEDTGTDLRLSEAAAAAEFHRRRKAGQKAWLERGVNDGRGPIEWEDVDAWHNDHDDDIGPFRCQPWPNEDADMERQRGIES